jgi:glycosyltransferase involved in cell wall biosynthesis
MSTAVLYLGKRGAGVIFCHEIASRLKDATVFVRKNSQESETNFSKNVIIEVAVPVRFLSYVFSLLFNRSIIKQIKTQIIANGINRIILPMPTPFDLKIISALSKSKIHVVSIIHDASPHPGDLWPNRSSIQRMVNVSTRIVCLSAYTKLKLQKVTKTNKHIDVVAHPIFPITKIKTNIIDVKNYSLVIGRIRKYKGISSILAAWQKLDSNDQTLVIAGEGKLPKKAFTMKKVLVINRWLSEEEFHSLLFNSESVIFPYNEASQSGVLPIAMYLKKRIVVTQTGALLEQSEHYQNRIVITAKDPIGIADQLQNFEATQDEPNEIRENPGKGWNELVEVLTL